MGREVQALGPLPHPGTGPLLFLLGFQPQEVGEDCQLAFSRRDLRTWPLRGPVGAQIWRLDLVFSLAFVGVFRPLMGSCANSAQDSAPCARYVWAWVDGHQCRLHVTVVTTQCLDSSPGPSSS